MSETTKEPQKPLSRDKLDIALASMFSHDDYQKDYVFYGHMIGQCSIVLERMEAPAAVSFHLDHYRLHINPEKFDDWTLEEQLAVLKHEMLHILNNHVLRKEDRDHQAFNYATDCAINQLINQKHLPQGCIVPATFPSKKKVPNNLSSEQYYELIDKDQLPPENPQAGNGSGGGHGKWDESQGDEELAKDITKNMIEKSVAQTQKSRGDIPSEISHYLDLFSRKAELDWKKVLRGITGNKKVNTRKTIMRRDRRNPTYEHIKGRTKDRMFDLLLVSDVSGSVSDDALYKLWGEVRHICDVTKTPCKLIQVDSRPFPPIELKKTTKTMPRQACGGTYLSPAIQTAKDHNLKFNAIVVTTDGELCDSDVAEFEKLNLPVIWLIESTGSVMPSMNKGRMRSFKLTDKE